ncbi:hypothetical protein [Agitococcus lubricus]|uniref:Uncharacterized protein n=1 Tax=Agitococcus lubricus TaxID=1077255 RepID=A0A2T5J236_9GAMM|nr:hypothetical protein [Agitococcus lubricus]PTQ90501.1 hypothetical protein C8N29_103256 [Agitococcus lubricus]
MLPLLTKPRVRIYLHPEQISVAQLRGWPQPTIIDYQVFSPSTHTSKQPTAELLLATLEQALSHLPKGSSIEMILANYYCRFVVVPWHDSLDSQGREQLSKALFNQQYAPEQALDYQFMADNCRFGQTQLVVAIKSSLLTAIEQLAIVKGHAFKLLQPSLVVVWNRFYRQLTGQQTLAIEEYHRLYVIHQDQGHLQQVTVQPSSLPLALEQVVYFNRTASTTDTLSNNCLLRLKPYQLPNDCADPYHAFTLCGVF